MTCPECQHDIAEHALYGCHAGEATIREDGLAALREKAALWDALSARIAAGEWSAFTEGEARVVLYKNKTGERIHGATLEEAIRMEREIMEIEKAMKAEGKR